MMNWQSALGEALIFHYLPKLTFWAPSMYIQVGQTLLPVAWRTAQAQKAGKRKTENLQSLVDWWIGGRKTFRRNEGWTGFRMLSQRKENSHLKKQRSCSPNKEVMQDWALPMYVGSRRNGQTHAAQPATYTKKHFFVPACYDDALPPEFCCVCVNRWWCVAGGVCVYLSSRQAQVNRPESSWTTRYQKQVSRRTKVQFKCHSIYGLLSLLSPPK